MPLSSGTKLGQYEITHVLGAGGMGEVYRARDSKLGRSVAIKVILQPFAADAERVSRFEREAKVLAALNHQHIAGLYGMDHADGQHFLVMELVEGETVAERLLRGPLPVEDAIRVAIQIADALETAHEKGIVHRDLKPANVKITPDDKVKVLDFGLAKALDTEQASAGVANSPTLSMMATSAGVILGTAAYMSPEQAKGFAADHRSDIFSFGIVLYEMLTGRQPFQGETAPDILASVLVREPELHKLPPDLNPRLPELLRRCLEKSPKRRWQAIGDVRAELEAVALMPRAAAPVGVGGPPKPLWRRALPVLGAALVAGVGGALAAWSLKPSPSAEMIRFAVSNEGQPWSGTTRQVVDISPDGRYIVYAASGQLHFRAMASATSKPISGTGTLMNVFSPTLSPDGESVAFYAVATRAIMKIPVGGGSAVTVTPVADNPYAVTWTEEGILFTQSDSVMRVSSNGGKPEKLASVEPEEQVQRVQLLPGSRAVIFTVAAKRAAPGQWAAARVVAQRLDSGERKTLVEGGSDGWYLRSGHLAYVVGGVVHAVPFDADRLEVKGGAVPIIEGVRRAALGSSGIAWFAVSHTGSLVYVPGPADVSATQLDVALVDRKGTISALKLPPAGYEFPRVSPDGRKIAVGLDDGRESAVLIYDVVRGGALQRSVFGGRNRLPIWAADSKRVVFQSDREGDLGIFWQRADGTAGPERLTKAATGEAHVPESWHPGGDILLYSVVKGSEHALWTYSVREKKTAPFASVRSGGPTDAVFSPNGKWVAYSGGDAALTTIYVQPFPATGAMYQLMRNASEVPHHPLWSPDGKELIINPAPATLEAVSITTEPTFAFGTRQTVPKLITTGPPSARRMHDLAPDGRFVGLIVPGATQGSLPATTLNVVVNWFEELKARAPRR